jgi:hypothetical protein
MLQQQLHRVEHVGVGRNRDQISDHEVTSGDLGHGTSPQYRADDPCAKTRKDDNGAGARLDSSLFVTISLNGPRIQAFFLKSGGL